MDNPARRLLAIYEEWASQYNHTLSDQDVRNIPQSAGVERHMEVFGLLASLRNSIAFYKTMHPDGFRVYEQAFDTWVRMGLNVPGNWEGGSDANAVFNPTALAHLETFATHLDFNQPSLPEGSAATLRDAIANAMELLAEDESITGNLRSYIYQLISELRTALDDEAVAGDFDFATSAHRLWVALWAAAGQSKGRRQRWTAAAKGMFRDAGAAALGSLPTAAITVAQIAAASPN